MNRRTRLQLVALEARDVPAIGPIPLPQGFTAMSGRGNLIDGVYQQHASITVLESNNTYSFTDPSTYYPGENNIDNAKSIDLTGGSFAYYGSTIGNDGVPHAVRLEVDRLGNVISKIASIFDDSVYVAAGLNGVSVGQAAGKAFVSSYNKSVFLADAGSQAVSVTRDGKYIVGTADGKPAGWAKQANGTYQSIAITAPIQSNGKGELTEVVGTYATGRYFDANRNEYHAAVWDLRDGNILHDLSAYGSTAGGGGIERIGREFVAVFNGANGQSPLVHVVGRNVSFPLGENLPAGKLGLYPGGMVDDLWVYDAGNDRSEMAVVVTTSNGKHLFQTFDGDNQNQALGGLTPTFLPNGFFPYKEIETTNGIIVAGYSGGRAGYVKVVLPVDRSAISVSNFVRLKSFSEVEFPNDPDQSTGITDVVRKANGVVTIIGLSENDPRSKTDQFQPVTAWDVGGDELPYFPYPTNTSPVQVTDVNTNLDVVGLRISDGKFVVSRNGGNSEYELPTSGNAVPLRISDDPDYILAAKLGQPGIGGVPVNGLGSWSLDPNGKYDFHELIGNTGTDSIVTRPSLLSIEGKYAFGHIYDISNYGLLTETYISVVWDTTTGQLIRNLSRDTRSSIVVEDEFGTPVTVNTVSIGSEKIGIFNTYTEFTSDFYVDPVVHLIESNRSFRLLDLPFGYAGGPGFYRIDGLWDRGNGSLGVVYVNLLGRYIIDSIEFNDLGQSWSTVVPNTNPPPPPNIAPTNLRLTINPIPEDALGIKVVGNLSADDPDEPVLRYTLLTRNSPFVMAGSSELYLNYTPLTSSVNGLLDYEKQSSYVLRIRAYDSHDAFTESEFVVQILDVSDGGTHRPPANLRLTATDIAENLSAGTVVGSILSDGVDGSPITYSILSEGLPFELVDGVLRATASLDYEQISHYFLAVRAIDGQGAIAETILTINVADAIELPPPPPPNQPPTDLQLTGNSVTENLPAGTVVGTLTATDPESSVLSFSLVTAGFPFEVVNGELRSTAPLDFETTPSYTLTLRATDPFGDFVEADFVVNVVDGDETRPVVPPVVPPTTPPVVPPVVVVPPTVPPAVPPVVPPIVVPPVVPPIVVPPVVPLVVPPVVVVPPTVPPLFPPIVVPPVVPPTLPPVLPPVVPPVVLPTSPPVIPPAVPPILSPAVPPTVTPSIPPILPQISRWLAVNRANTIGVIDAASGLTVFSATPFGIPGTGTAVDFTGDGVPDLLAAAGPGGGPHVRLIDSATGLDIFSFYAFAEDFTGGVNVAAADVNRDGTLDIITAAGPGGGPHVRVWNGRDGRELMSFFAYDEAFGGGVNVASADIDGDGFEDIITGAGAGGGPHVRAISGRTGAELLSYMAYDDYRGGVFVAAADFDGDGIAEIVTGAGPGGGPHVRIWTGEQRIAETFVSDPTHTDGTRVTTRDTDGDGIADVLITVRGSQAYTLASNDVRNRTLTAQPFDEIPFGVFVG